MEVRLYKNFSDAYETKTAAAGTPLQESFADIDLSKYAVLVNGKIKNENYKPQEKDTILLRRIPRGTDYTNVGWWFATIFTGGIYNAIDAGCQAYYTKKKLEKLEKEMENTSTTADSVKNMPYIAGASNSIATGKTQPYIMGKHLFTPYVLNGGGYGTGAASGFHTISGETGEKSFYNVLLEGGFNKQVIRKLRADTTVIKTWADTETTPQEGIYSFDTSSDFNDDENVIEIRQEDGTFTTAEFQKKIVEVSSGSALGKADDDDYEPLVFTLEKHAMAANIVISFAGLVQYDSDDGTKMKRTVNVYPEYSLDNGTTWTRFTFDQNGTASNTFTYNTLNEIRFQAHIDFDYNEIKDLEDAIQVRVTTDTEAYDGSAYDTPTVLYYQSVIYNPTESAEAGEFVADRIIEPTEAALSTIIGIKVKATDTNEDKLSKINIITSGIARTWNGESWTAEKTPTANLAAVVLEVMTSDTHKPSKCDITDDTDNDTASSDEIDLESFGAWYEFCEENEIEINEVLTDGATKQSVIESLLSIGQATLYNNIYGKIAVAIDQKQENAIAILNSQNLVSLSWEKDMTRRTDGIKCTYISAAGDYAEDCYIVMRDGKTRDADSTLREENLKGITNQPQVVKYARRLMAIDELRPNIITAEVGQEAIFYTPYAKVLLQHPALKIGLGTGAEIKGIILNEAKTQVTGLTLFDAIDYDGENSNGFGVVIQAVNGSGITEIAKAYTAEADGRVYKINFVEPIDIENASVLPKRGDVLSYGYLNDDGGFDTITSPYIINSLEPGEKTVTMQLLDYNEAIYDSGTIPAYTPNLTQPRTPKTVTAAKKEITLDDVTNFMSEGGGSTAPDTLGGVIATAEENKITLSFKNTGSGTANSLKAILYEISKDGGSTWAEVSSDTLESEYAFNRTTDGYPEATTLANWKVRAKAQNLAGLWSEEYCEGTIDTDSYGTWTVQAPNITSHVSGRAITLQISQPARSDGRTVYGTIKNRVQIKRVTETADTQYYKPATSADPYASEDNYKIAGNTGYVETTTLYQQTMPLKGQNETEPLPVDTTYKFSIVAANEAGTSDATESDNITALATGASDIVKAAITANKIATGAVTTDTLADTAVTTAKLAAAAVSSAKIADSAITEAKLGAAAVTTAKLATAAVTTDVLAATAVTEAKIAASAVTTAKINNSAITTVKIADDAITADKIAANTITASEIAAGTITATELASGSVTTAKLDALAVTADKIAASTITGAKIAATTITGSNIAANTITTAKLAVGTGANLVKYGFDTWSQRSTVPIYGYSGAKPTLNTAAAYIYYGTQSLKLTASNSDNYVYLGDSATNYGCIPVTAGKVYVLSCWAKATAAATAQLYVVSHTAINSTNSAHNGATVTLAANTWTRIQKTFTASSSYPYISIRIDNDTSGSTIYFDAFQLEEVDSTSKTAGDFAPAGVTVIDGGNITASTVTASQLASSAVTTDKLEALAVTAAKIAGSTITGDKIAAGTITADNIAAENLAANGATFGNISGDAVKVNANNYWQLDTDSTGTYETGEFRIGNDKSLEESDDDDAAYIHYKPSTGLLMKIKKFLLKSIGAVFVGPVYIKASATTADSKSFMTINPTNSSESTTGRGSGCVGVGGNVIVDSMMQANVCQANTIKLFSGVSYSITDTTCDLSAVSGGVYQLRFYNTSDFPAHISIRVTVGNSAAQLLDFDFIRAGTEKMIKNLTYGNMSDGGPYIVAIYYSGAYCDVYVKAGGSYYCLFTNSTFSCDKTAKTSYTGTLLWTGPTDYTTIEEKITHQTFGKESLPIYLKSGVPTQCTASSLFSALSSASGTNLSATIAGQARTITSLYATYLAGIGAQTTAATSGTTSKWIYATKWSFTIGSNQNAYIVFSNGLKIQWGVYDSSTTLSTVTISSTSYSNCRAFQIAFTNTPAMAHTFTAGGNNTCWYSEHIRAVSNAYWQMPRGTQYYGQWIAIGY